MSEYKLSFFAPRLSLSFHPQTFGISTGTPVVREYVERPAYEGEYDVTPSAQEIILNTQHLRMTDNVRIAPIPNNYGLITWNGSTLTVS